MPRPPENRLRDLMEANELHPADLARIAGRDQRTVERWRDGRQAIPDHKKQVIASYFGVSPAHLMGWDDDVELPDAA